LFQSYRGTPAGVILSLINESTNTGVDTLRQVEAMYPAAFQTAAYNIFRKDIWNSL
jgi:hypothetical protein